VNVLGPKAAGLLAVCALAHAVTDAICAGILLSLWRHKAMSWPDAISIFGLYNLLAFGAQPLFGWLVDWSRQARTAALIGCVLVVGAALAFQDWPLPALVAAGTGNALFHLGAGSICLRLTPGRAMGPGIFVAPGDLGLFFGTYLGQSGLFVAWPFVLVLVVLGLVLMRLPLPGASAFQPVPVREWKSAGLVLVPLLACVAARSFVGFSVATPWKSALWLGLALAVAVTFGKALGGLLADWLGWGRIAVGGLLVSTPLLAFGAHSPAAAMAGFLLFNLTMPVTLAAVANLFPARPAFAFGLTCLALEVGGWPVIQASGSSGDLGLPWIVFGVSVASAIALYSALHMASKWWPANFARTHGPVSVA
jgi:FSR family fosmidomycin resistance protein-like MFS transporter